MQPEDNIHKKFYEMEVSLKRSFSAVKADIGEIKTSIYNQRKELAEKTDDVEESIKAMLADFVTGEQLDAEMASLQGKVKTVKEKLDAIDDQLGGMQKFHSVMLKELTAIRKIHAEIQDFRNNLDIIQKNFITMETAEAKLTPLAKRLVREQVDKTTKKMRKDIDKLKKRKPRKNKVLSFFFEPAK